MAIIVGCVGPKGGPGKSTAARIIATKIIRSGHTAKIIDHDKQKTCERWASKREDYRAAMLAKKKVDPDKVPPRVPVEYYGVLEEGLAEADAFDFLVVDAAGKAGPEILRIAQVADIVVMPCNPGGDDLDPTIEIYKALLRLGIPKSRLVCMLNHVGKGPEETAARNELERHGVQVLGPPLREMVKYRTAMTFGLSPMECSGPQADEAEAVADALIAKIMEIYGEGSDVGHQNAAIG